MVEKKPLRAPSMNPHRLDARPASVDQDDALDFARFFEAMPAAAFVIDAAKGRIVHGNQAAIRLCGYTPSQLRNRKAERLFPRSELGRFWETVGPWDDPPSEFIGWVLTRSGEEVPISALCKPLPAPESDLQMLLAFDITELKLDSGALDGRANQDSLTGLPNREAFEREFDRRSQTRPPARSCALLYIDLDDLKRINDAYGHAQGDAVLAGFAQRLQTICGDAAFVSRYGSDEFTVVYDDLPASLLDARREITRRVEALQDAARRPYQFDSRSLISSCSIGIALEPHDAEGRESLLVCADLALQQAKRGARDSYRFFIEADLRRLNEEVEIEARLREVIRYEAVEQEWLPLYRLQDGACIGIESLLRGGATLHGIDTAFIVEIAEARGLLPELGRLNVRRSMNAFKRLVLSGRDAVIQHMCLNISAQELLAPGFVEEFFQTTNSAAIPLDRIVVEIGELDLFASVNRVRLSLEQLQQRNVQIAIDGFGTGFSSLTLLRDLPIDMIKIDRSFVWQLEASQRDREIVHAMIQLAHSLGVKATAVGVETQAQLDALRTMRCDYAQGYLLSRPLPLDDLSDYLRRHVSRSRAI